MQQVLVPPPASGVTINYLDGTAASSVQSQKGAVSIVIATAINRLDGSPAITAQSQEGFAIAATATNHQDGTDALSMPVQ